MRLEDTMKVATVCKSLHSVICLGKCPQNQKIWQDLYKAEFFYEPSAFPDVDWATADGQSRYQQVFLHSFQKYKRMRKLVIDFVTEFTRNIAESGKLPELENNSLEEQIQPFAQRDQPNVFI